MSDIPVTRISIHSLRGVLEPMIKAGEIAGWDFNGLELPQHFHGVVKHIKGITFTACPSCLSDDGYGSKARIDPTEKNPHREAYTPGAWISAQHEIFGRLAYAHTQSHAHGGSFCEGFKISPRGLAPIGSNLHRFPIGIAIGEAIQWPDGMIEGLGAGNLPNPNINFAVICPEHGSVWATISREMSNLLLLCANIANGGDIIAPPNPLPVVELMDKDPAHWSYDPDDDLPAYASTMTIKDHRNEEERKKTFGFIAAADKSADPAGPVDLHFFPYADEVDQLAAEDHIVEKYRKFGKLSNHKARDYEGGNIPVGRVLRHCFENSALDSNDGATFHSIAERQ